MTDSAEGEPAGGERHGEGCAGTLQGLVVVAGLLIAQLVLTGPLDGLADRRFDAVLGREQATLWWREDPFGRWPWIAAGAFGMALVMWAFGGVRGLAPWPDGRRRLAVGAAVAALALAAALKVALAPVGGGYATAQGAAWFGAGGVAARHDWIDAVAVEASCRMEPEVKRKAGEPPPLSMIYRVGFADGRWALLSYGSPPLAYWMEEVAPIDAALKATGRPRTGVVEAACLASVAPGQVIDRPRLGRLLAP